MDTSTESDGEAKVINGGSMSRNNWSDWCRQKTEKSSQSDDDNNNNSNYIGVRSQLNNSGHCNNNILGIAIGASKKRKKLTRKAASASKSAFGVINVNKENKEESGTNNAINNRGRKGRIKKGGRGRKSLKIVGLDVLHKQTLLSTSVELLSKKLPPAPGCVDQQLTSLLTGDMSHTELDIPTAPQKTPYALQILLDVLRGQYMTMMEQMRTPYYELQIQDQIKIEQKRKQNLRNRASQLEKQIKVLIHDSVALLRSRMNELGISVSSPNELIAKAKEIVGRHKELQSMAKRIQVQVTACELEQRQLLKHQMQQMSVCKKKLDCLDLCEATAHDLVLKEIANTLTQRKKLYAQIAALQQEAAMLERHHNMLINTVTSATSTTITPSMNHQLTTATTSVICTPIVANNNVHNNICDNQPLQLTVSHKNKVATIVPNDGASPPINVKFTKSPRRQQNREHVRDVSSTQRLRSQDWPDVPDVGKIEESNPEVLAQKILETGRQIEAGKYMPNNNKQQLQQIEIKSIGRKSIYNNNGKRFSTISANPASSTYENHLTPAQTIKNQDQQYHDIGSIANSTVEQQQVHHHQSPNGCSISNCKESPKVANFEHRLKSIITSVLNEDQEQRKQQMQHTRIYDMQNQQKTQQVINALSIKHQQQSNLMHLNSNTTISAIESSSNNIKSNIADNKTINKMLFQQTPTTSSNISTYSNSVVAQKFSNKDVAKCHVHSHQHTTATNLTTHNRRRSTITGTNLEQHVLQEQQKQTHLEFKAPNLSRATSREQLLDYADTTRPPRSSSAHSDNPKKSPSKSSLSTPQSCQGMPSTAICTANSIMVEHPGGDVRKTPPPLLLAHNRLNPILSQPDYTQVSPAKMALRRHLSQEKLHQLQHVPIVTVSSQQHQNITPITASSQHQHQHIPSITASSQQHQQSFSTTTLATKTIGDLVNGEIERTLEISHQSIINAVVNKSTVGNNVVTSNNNGSTNNNYNTERLSFQEHLVINPNVQRPERVNIRILDDSTSALRPNQTSTIHKYNHTNCNIKNNGNLLKLSHGAYNHKLMQASNNVCQQSTQKCSPNTNISAPPYQPVALPRAEIKGCIEAYFNDDHNLQKSMQPQEEQFQQHQKSTIKEHNKTAKDHRLNATGRNNRLNGVGNPPLEGLAASLQDHMLASRKYKEGQEERQRRATIVTNYVEPPVSMAIPTTTIKHQYNRQQPINGPFEQQNGIPTPEKMENGVKRNSSTTSNQSRPNKIAHYTHEQTQYLRPQHHLYMCSNGTGHLQQQQAHSTNSNQMPLDPNLMSPEINSMLSDESLKYLQHQQSKHIQHHYQQISQHPTNGQPLNIQQMQHHLMNNRNTPLSVGGRAADDGKIINDKYKIPT